MTGSSKSSLQRWKLPKAQRTNPVLMKLRTSESVSRFPLSDTEYEVQENELLKNAMDEFCSTSFIEETTNLKKKTSFEKAVQYYSQLCENKENQPVKEKYKHKEAGNFIKERKYELEKRQLEDEMEKMYNMEKQRKNNKNHQFDGEIPCCSKSLRRESPKKNQNQWKHPQNFHNHHIILQIIIIAIFHNKKCQQHRFLHLIIIIIHPHIITSLFHPLQRPIRA